MEEHQQSADRSYWDRQSHYRGRAKLNILNLDFELEHVSGGRTVDQKNVERLIKVFTPEGCLPLEPEHRVPILIECDRLLTSLQLSHLDQPKGECC